MAGQVFVIMAPPDLASYGAHVRAPAPSCHHLALALLAGGMIEVIRFHRTLQPAIRRDGCIAEPPAPAITGPGMDP